MIRAFSRLSRLMALTAASCALSTSASLAALTGCDGDITADADKVLFGSMSEIAENAGLRFARRLVAATDMQLANAQTSLHSVLTVLYCSGRLTGEASSFDRDVTQSLNSENVLLEVGARKDAGDIVVAYVIIPLRYYTYFQDNAGELPGYFKSLHDPGAAEADPTNLFRNSPELKLMAALGLAVRSEKLAEAATEPSHALQTRQRARAYYCDALSALEAARPDSASFSGLDMAQWQALNSFVLAGIERLFDSSTAAGQDRGVLVAVEAIRAGTGVPPAICAETLTATDGGMP